MPSNKQNLTPEFFDRDPQSVAKELLGKLIQVKHDNQLLSAQIIETEAYYIDDKASHASLGFTTKRQALFMPPGTIYMYYARGGDSLNFSCRGEGNAVLIKSAIPFPQEPAMIEKMQQLNPHPSINPRPVHKLCSGQTLLCKSLHLKVTDWDAKSIAEDNFDVVSQGYFPKKIIQTTRLGIPVGRDEHLPYRFIDYDYACFCSSNPLTKRNWIEGRDFRIYQ